MKKQLFLLFNSALLLVSIAAQAAKSKTDTLPPRQERFERIQKELDTQQLSSDTADFDVEAKRKAVEQLVKRGAEYFNTHTIADTCNRFTHTKDFILGELYLYLFDYDGRCYAHGQQADLVWKNLHDLRDTFGSYIIQLMIEKAKSGGGWVNYQWRDAAKVSYIMPVEKDGKPYLVGAGYYPHSKSDAVINLVKGAVTYFND